MKVAHGDDAQGASAGDESGMAARLGRLDIVVSVLQRDGTSCFAEGPHYEWALSAMSELNETRNCRDKK